MLCTVCVLQAVNVASTVVAIILVDRLGRRFLFIQGGVQMILCEVRGLAAAAAAVWGGCRLLPMCRAGAATVLGACMPMCWADAAAVLGACMRACRADVVLWVLEGHSCPESLDNSHTRVCGWALTQYLDASSDTSVWALQRCPDDTTCMFGMFTLALLPSACLVAELLTEVLSLLPCCCCCAGGCGYLAEVRL